MRGSREIQKAIQIAKKIPFLLGTHLFFAFLILFAAALGITYFVFSIYVSSIQSLEINVQEAQTEFAEETFVQLLQEQDARAERFLQVNTTNYRNIFKIQPLVTVEEDEEKELTPQ